MSNIAPTANAATLLHTQDLHKTYRMGGEDLHVLRGVNLSVRRGEWLAILGASGSGKSTLLHLLGGLDWPERGGVIFNDRNIYDLGSRAVNRYRNRDVGFVFQFYHLLPELTALENVLIASMVGRSIFGWPGIRGDLRDRARGLLDQLGLGARLRHRPAKLSGGERQRVAIARALINNPPLLLADEPTGNLDSDTGKRLLDVFAAFHQQGQTVVMVTHDLHIAQKAQRRLTLEDGRLRGT